jgi:hypothetical protein
MAPILAALASKGLNLIYDAVSKKGQEFVEEKLGVKLKPDMSDEDALKLKQIEFDNEESLRKWALENRKLDIEETRIYLDDVAKARHMQEVALGQADVFAKRFIYYAAIGILLFSGVYITAVTFMPIPESNLRFVDTVLGFVLGTLVSTVVYFFFGSSRQNKAKDDSIAAMVKELGK